MASVTTPPKRAPATTSTDPLYTQAVAQAKAALSAAQAPVQSEQAASDTYYRQRQTDATDNAKALNDLLKGIAPATQGVYENAAQNQELAANGFSQGMKDALQGNTDNLNAMLQKLGSPAQLDSHTTEAGDVLYGLGGYQPGSTFRREGAAFGAAAAQLPGTALLKGQETYKQVGLEGNQAHTKFDQALAEMAGKLPGDVEDNYQKLHSLALEDARFRQQVNKDNFDRAYKIAQQKLSVAKYKTDVDYKNANLRLSDQRLQLAANKFAQQQFQQDREYALSLSRLGIAQKSLQLRVAAQEFKYQNGGLTPTQLNKAQGYLTALAASVHQSEGPNGERLFQVNTGKDKSGKPMIANIRYEDFVARAAGKGVPISMAIEAANRIFPEVDRAPAAEIAKITGLSQAAAANVTGYGQTSSDYNNMVGVAKGGKVVLATGPQGQQVSLQMPRNVSAKTRATLGNVVNLAVEYLGTPYAWGGGGPSGPSRGTGRGANTVGFDCSSFAEFLYAKSNITIPRTTYQQYQMGMSVPKSALRVGDLVFFKGSDSVGGLPGHVGIYIGNGQMIHAPHTGDVIRVASVSSVSGYQGARRYTGG